MYLKINRKVQRPSEDVAVLVRENPGYYLFFDHRRGVVNWTDKRTFARPMWLFKNRTWAPSGGGILFENVEYDAATGEILQFGEDGVKRLTWNDESNSAQFQNSLDDYDFVIHATLEPNIIDE